MTLIDRLFVSPASVASFWTKSDQPNAAREMEDGTVAFLAIGEDLDANWRIVVEHPDEDGFVFEEFRPFFPSRSNLRYFNAECSRASRIFNGVREGTLTAWPDEEPLLLQELECDDRARPKSIRVDPYRELLWQLFAKDWGIILPPPDRFGEGIVRFEFRPGLPCAAAMARAVQCIIEAALGSGLELFKQHLVTEGRRNVDVIEYKGKNGVSLTQRFDITEIYGLSLPTFTFDP